MSALEPQATSPLNLQLPELAPYADGIEPYNPPTTSDPRREEEGWPHLSSGEIENGAGVDQGASSGDTMMCGLHTAVFWLLIALITVMLCAGIGGGVGGGLAVKQAKTAAWDRGCLRGHQECDRVSESTLWSDAPTPSPTSTSQAIYTPLLATQVSELPLPECTDDAMVPATYNTTAHFKILCAYELNAAEIVYLIMYNFEDCMNACERLNDQSLRLNLTCGAVTFWPKLAASWRSVGGNCVSYQPAYDSRPTIWHGAFSAKLCKDKNCNETYFDVR